MIQLTINQQQAPKKMISAVELAKIIRQELKKQFPNHSKFSVRKINKNRLSIEWEDGTTKNKVQEFLERFKGGTWNNSTGFMDSKFFEMNGEKISSEVYYMDCTRYFSQAVMTRESAKIAKRYNQPAPALIQSEAHGWIIDLIRDDKPWIGNQHAFSLVGQAMSEHDYYSHPEGIQEPQEQPIIRCMIEIRSSYLTEAEMEQLIALGFTWTVPEGDRVWKAPFSTIRMKYAETLKPNSEVILSEKTSFDIISEATSDSRKTAKLSQLTLRKNELIQELRELEREIMDIAFSEISEN